MQGIFQKENTDKALKYGIYRHLPTYEKIIRNLVSFYLLKNGIHPPPIFYIEVGGLPFLYINNCITYICTLQQSAKKLDLYQSSLIRMMHRHILNYSEKMN